MKIHMFSGNSINPLPHDEAFSIPINGNHDHVSRYKFYCLKDKLGEIGKKNLLCCYAWPKHPRFNISAKQDLPLPDS